MVREMYRTAHKLSLPDSWNSVGTYLPDHNTVVPSDSAMIDYYPATILLREPLDHHHYLFAIYTGGEYYFGVPPGWNMRIKINGLWHGRHQQCLK